MSDIDDVLEFPPLPVEHFKVYTQKHVDILRQQLAAAEARVVELELELQATLDAANQIDVWREQERRVLNAIAHPKQEPRHFRHLEIMENMRLASLGVLHGLAPEENDALAALEGG